MEKPFSTKTLSERWNCTDQHVRDLIGSGELKAFRIGRLYRIPYTEVLRVEKCDYSFTEENGASIGEMGLGQDEGPWVRPTVT